MSERENVEPGLFAIFIGVILFASVMYPAGIIGFFARAIWYGFIGGMETFDEVFRTKAFKRKNES